MKRPRSISPRAKSSTEGSGGAFSLRDIREFAAVLREYGLAELEFDRGGERIRLRIGNDPAEVAVTPEAPSKTVGAATRPVTQKVDAPEKSGVYVKSPFVGTFYRAPSPETPPYVQVGEVVKKGQVLCIVEAMKLMNEIEAEADGRVEEILVENGEPVEYGASLFRLTPA